MPAITHPTATATFVRLFDMSETSLKRAVVVEYAPGRESSREALIRADDLANAVVVSGRHAHEVDALAECVPAVVTAVPPGLVPSGGAHVVEQLAHALAAHREHVDAHATLAREVEREHRGSAERVGARRQDPEALGRSTRG